jgi:hypothetical protein
MKPRRNYQVNQGCSSKSLPIYFDPLQELNICSQHLKMILAARFYRLILFRLCFGYDILVDVEKVVGIILGFYLCQA